MAEKTQYSKNTILTAVTIANGAGTATAQLEGTKLIGVIFPATMTNTAFDVEHSFDGSTWYKIYDRFATKLTITVVSGIAQIAPEDSYGLEGFIRINGSNEGAERELQFISRPI